MQSATALIPSFFGVLFVAFGALAHKENLRKHVMHAAAVLALVCLGATFKGGVLGGITLLSGGEVARPPAAISMGIMFVICLIFLILCIRSFVMARRRRAQ